MAPPEGSGQLGSNTKLADAIEEAPVTGEFTYPGKRLGRFQKTH